MSFSRLAFFALHLVLLATSSVGSAQEARSTPGDVDCSPGEPDSVQNQLGTRYVIAVRGYSSPAWDAGCGIGTLLPKTRLRGQVPARVERRRGHGVVQWFEHGRTDRSIDSEGSYVWRSPSGTRAATHGTKTNWFDGPFTRTISRTARVPHTVAGEMFRRAMETRLS